MNTNVAQLVVPPSVDDEIKQNMLKHLRKTIEDVEAGDVDCVVIIMGHPDGGWSDRASETKSFAKAVGMLEIVKHRWINQNIIEAEK